MSHDVIDFEDELRGLLHARAASLEVGDPPPIEAVALHRPLPVRVSRHRRTPFLVAAAVVAVALLGVAGVILTSEESEVISTDNPEEVAEDEGTAEPATEPEPIMVPVADAPVVGEGYPLVAQIYPAPPCSESLPFSYTSLPEGFGSQLVPWDPAGNVLDESGVVIDPMEYDFSVVHVAASPDRHITMRQGSGTEGEPLVQVVAFDGVDYRLEGVGVTEAELAAFGEDLVACEQQAPATLTRPGS